MEKRENKRSLPTTGLATSREKREREKARWLWSGAAEGS